jgi:carbonic anhydrase
MNARSSRIGRTAASVAAAGCLLLLAACGGAPPAQHASESDGEAPAEPAVSEQDLRDLEVRVLSLEVEVLDLKARLDAESGATASVDDPMVDGDVVDGEAEPDEPEGPYWTYDVQSQWADLSPDYATCRDGLEQSPVDLIAATPADLPNAELVYDFSVATIEHDGRVLSVSADDAGSIVLDGVTYGFRELHVHAPSEHTVDGIPFAAEVQMLHTADDGSKAVIAVMIEQGEFSEVYDGLIRSLPEEENVEGDVAGGIDPRGMLPTDIAAYRYRGSLSFPPCTEGVQWVVMQSTVTMDDAQLDALTDAIGEGNARTTQPLHDRVIQLDTSSD